VVQGIGTQEVPLQILPVSHDLPAGAVDHEPVLSEEQIWHLLVGFSALIA